MKKIRYTWKFRATSWEKLSLRLKAREQSFWYSADGARAAIEELQRPGCTSGPYVQLVQIDGDDMLVVAECKPGPYWTAL